MNAPLIDRETDLKLITAPERVRTAYVKTGDWLAWWYVGGNPRPSQKAIDEAFWNVLAQLGGTDEDFDWLLAAGLCDSTDRDAFARARASV